MTSPNMNILMWIFLFLYVNDESVGGLLTLNTKNDLRVKIKMTFFERQIGDINDYFWRRTRTRWPLDVIQTSRSPSHRVIIYTWGASGKRVQYYAGKHITPPRQQRNMTWVTWKRPRGQHIYAYQAGQSALISLIFAAGYIKAIFGIWLAVMTRTTLHAPSSSSHTWHFHVTHLLALRKTWGHISARKKKPTTEDNSSHFPF
jgi:hypothetical protein